jgi:N-acetylglucosamine-6-phosphate deacetylase
MNTRVSALIGAKVFDGFEIKEDLAIIINGRHIDAVIDIAELPETVPKRDLGGGMVAPGFIDLQVNGGGGVLLNADPTPEGVCEIARAHRRFGTIGLLPTVITDAPEVISKALRSVSAARELGEAAVFGIHVEGPFIDPKRKGAHDARYIRKITERDIAELSGAQCGCVLLTLAPNCVAAEIIAKLAAAGIIVSLGHSDANASEVQAALKAGGRMFTHLFNAMSQMESRAPGMVGAAFADEESYCSIIADGHHVQDTALKAAIRAKGADHIVLVSDAMSSAAGGPDYFELQGRLVRREEGRLRLEDGTLAGSDLTLDKAVRYCANKLNVRLEDALRMASANPAKVIGRDDELGHIAPGYLASMVHLNDNLEVQDSWVEGENMEPS